MAAAASTLQYGQTLMLCEQIGTCLHDISFLTDFHLDQSLWGIPHYKP